MGYYKYAVAITSYEQLDIYPITRKSLKSKTVILGSHPGYRKKIRMDNGVEYIVIGNDAMYGRVPRRMYATHVHIDTMREGEVHLRHLPSGTLKLFEAKCPSA